MKHRNVETTVGIFVLSALAIFFFLTFQIGFLRFDHTSYHTYTVVLNASSGLNRKDEVRIAGIKVGWVDAVKLFCEKNYQVQATVKVASNCILYKDCYALIRQDGLLGRKHVELVPGTFSDQNIKLNPGDIIMCRDGAGQSIDDLMHIAQEVAQDISSVTSSIKQSINPAEFSAELSGASSSIQKTVNQVKQVVDQLAQITTNINTLINQNQESIKTVIGDLVLVVKHIKEQLPELTQETKTVLSKISQDLAPQIQESTRELTQKLTESVTTVTDSVGRASNSLDLVLNKINNGEGTLGKLINDESVYQDLCDTTRCVKSLTSRFDEVCFGVDAHFEYLHSFDPLSDVKNDFKGYLNGYFYPYPTCFLLGGITARKSGRVNHENLYVNPEDPCDVYDKTGICSRLKPTEKLAVRDYDKLLWNMQIGKSFGPLTLRGGLFESTAGVGCDVCLPITESVRLMTTLECYDFYGKLHIYDHRPHCKWLNRLFFTKSAYLDFGVDDFASQYNTSFFIGLGMTFGAPEPGCAPGYCSWRGCNGCFSS